MSDELILCGLVSIPTGIVISLSTPVGIIGTLAFIGGAAFGALTGRYLGREFAFRCLPLNQGLQQITALALTYLATISGGWALVNLGGFVISFKASILAQLGGIMLLGFFATLWIIAEEIRRIFQKCRRYFSVQ